MHRRRLARVVVIVIAGVGLLVASVTIVGYASAARTHDLQQGEGIDLFLPLTLLQVRIDTYRYRQLHNQHRPPQQRPRPLPPARTHRLQLSR